MFVVTNRITVKTRFRRKMAPRFTQGGKIESLKGFNKIEVWQVNNEDDETEDMYVNTWWETEDDFNNWVKAMHLKRRINDQKIQKRRTISSY